MSQDLARSAELTGVDASKLLTRTVATATHAPHKRSLSIRRSLTCGGLMRRSLIGITVAFSFALAAPAVAHEPPFSWTGLYVGANAGYSWGRAAADLAVLSVTGPIGSASRSIDVNGWLGGGHVGYSWQSQRWVYGVEADFQWTGEDGDDVGLRGTGLRDGELRA